MRHPEKHGKSRERPAGPGAGRNRTTAAAGRPVRRRAAAATAALEDSERRMQLALRVSHSFTFDWDPATDRVIRSASCGTILGLGEQDAVMETGSRYFERIHPDDRDGFLRKIRALTPASADYTAEYRVVRDNAGIVSLEEVGQASFDAAGRLTRVIGVVTDITRRKQAEDIIRRTAADLDAANASLRDSRQAAINLMTDALDAREKAAWLARFPEENPNPVVRVATNGITLYTNPAAAERPGWAGEVGRPAAAPLRALVKQAEAARQGLEGDVEFEGRTYLVAVTLFPEERYANLYGHDVTEHRRAEAREREAMAVAAAAQTAADILTALGEGVLMLDLKGRILQVNPALERMCGIPAGELIGRPVRTFLPAVLAPENPRLITRALAAMQSGRDPHLSTLTLLPRNGRRLSVIPSVTFLRDLTNRPTRIVITLRDISDLLNAQEAQVESDRKYRELVENANSIIMRITPDHVITFFNEYAQTFFGYRAEDVLGRPVIGTITPETDSGGRDLRELMRRITTDPEGHASNENENMCKDGRRVWVHWANRAVRDAQGAVREILCVGTDITRRREMELEALRYQRRLRELAERLMSAEEEERWRISRYIHDTIIQNLSLSVIRMDSMEKPLQKHKLNETRDKLREIRALIEQASHECRTVMSELTPSLLYELGLIPALHELAERLQAKHGARISIDGDGQEQPMPPPLRGLLFESARELVMNALKYAGPCEIRLLLDTRENEELAITVADNGRGFDPAAGLHQNHQGGFGLFSIRQRLEGLGGRLDIQAAPGKGTIATIRVPLAGAAQ